MAPRDKVIQHVVDELGKEQQKRSNIPPIEPAHEPEDTWFDSSWESSDC